MNNNKPTAGKNGKHLSEDWLAVLIAFGLILLSALGILGEKGLMIFF